MKYFLIDYENIGQAGFKGFEALSGNDKIVLFYSKNANKIDISMMQKLKKCHAEIDYVQVDRLGHNALDFNLVCYIGTKIGKFKGNSLDIIIISKDSGYDTLFAAQFIPDNVTISRREFISAKNITKNTIETINYGISDLLTDKTLKKYAKIAETGISKTKTLTDFHNYLVKEIGTADGSKIYNLLKKTFEKVNPTKKIESTSK